ncbi:MAG: polysaccharide deacetylase [Alicyclobacillus sp.]|nr:polysaccharide deacetylase [Alicyclobacillus sp.]
MNRTFRRMWMAWEAVFRKLAHLETIGDDREYLFYVAKHRYIGKPFQVDGVDVRRFDPVIEIHMNNDLLAKVLNEEQSSMRLGVRLLNEAKQSLPALARHVSGPEFAREQVLYGATFIHRSVERFGWTSFPIRQQWISTYFTRYLQIVFKVVNPHAASILQTHAEDFVPRVVAISKAKLLARYAVREAADPQ